MKQEGNKNIIYGKVTSLATNNEIAFLQNLKDDILTILITIGEHFGSRGENIYNSYFFMHCQYFQNMFFLPSLVNETVFQKNGILRNVYCYINIFVPRLK